MFVSQTLHDKCSWVSQYHSWSRAATQTIQVAAEQGRRVLIAEFDGKPLLKIATASPGAFTTASILLSDVSAGVKCEWVNKDLPN